MAEASLDHRQFLDLVIAALNGPDDEAARAFASDRGWEAGGFRRLVKLRRDRVVFSSAGVLSERGRRTLGCVRYERPDAAKPIRSAFILLAQGPEGVTIEGVYEEIPLALAWLRGWIEAGTQGVSLPSTPDMAALAERLCEVPHGQLGAFLIDELQADAGTVARVDTMLPDGAARVLGVHVLEVVGRGLIGLAVGPMELWLVVERDEDRFRCIAVAVRPSMTALLTGARAAAPAPEAIESDVFLQRLLGAVRGRIAAAATSDLTDEREKFRAELIERLNASFKDQIPADEAVVAALRQTLATQPARGRSVGELVAAVLEQIAQKPG